MKKIFLSCVILAFGMLELPAFATYNTWEGLVSNFDTGLLMPIEMGNSINQDTNPQPLTNWSQMGQAFTMMMVGYTLTGNGSSPTIFNNAAGALNISGGIISSVNGSNYSLRNNGTLGLVNMTSTNGLLQSEGTFYTYNGDDYAWNTTTLSGNNNITGGTVEIRNNSNVLIFDGGVLTKGAALSVTGPTNTFQITNGSVTMTSNPNEQWEDGGTIVLTNGNLTLDNYSHSTNNSGGAYQQTGGTLNLINNSHLTLSSTDSSITTDGSGTGVSTVNIGSTTGNDTSSLTLGTGSTIATAAAGDTLTVNIGQGSTGNSLNIAGGTLGSTATVNINTGNSLNISSGIATLNGSGAGADTWNGNVNLSGTGNLTLDHLMHETAFGAYSQSGGTLNVIDGSNLILYPGSQITTAGGGTTTVNVGVNGGGGSQLALNGGTITTSNAGGITNINVGNGSYGNSVFVNATSSITNGISGHTNLNIGVDSTTNNSVQLSTGTITGTGTTVNIGTTAPGSINNNLTISGTGNLDTTATVVINANNNLNISGGTATLDVGDTYNGNVNVSGTGNLTLNNISNQAGSTFTQTSGTTNIAGSTLTLGTGSSITGGNVTIDEFSTMAINNGLTTNAAVVTMLPSASNGILSIGNDASHHASALTLNSGSLIQSHNTINIGDNSGTNIGNSLTMGDGVSVLGGISVFQGNNLNITGGTVGTPGYWDGAVNLSGTGGLTLSGYNQSGNCPNGIYTQNGANTNLTLLDMSRFILGSGSYINSGSITAPDGNSVIIVSGGTIAEAAVVSVPFGGGGGMQITAGNVTLNGAPGPYASDTWTNDGMLYLSGTGTLTLDNLTHEATTGMGGPAYLQTGGTLNLTNGSNFILDTTNSIANSGAQTATVNVGGGAVPNILALNGGTITSANGTTNINIGNGSNGNILRILDDASSISNGAGGITNVNIGVGSSTNNALNLLAGSITGTGTTVNIGTIAAGSAGNALNLSGTGNIDPTATLVINANNSLNVSGGTATINENGAGTDTWAGTINLTGGTLTLDSIVSHGAFNQSGGSIIIGDTVSRVYNNGGLVRSHNLSGGDIDLRANGHLVLDSADTWTATNVLNSAGKLTLDHFSHDTTTGGTYNQTNGTLDLANGSTMKIGTGSSITGGSILYTGTGNTLDISTDASFDAARAINITAGNNFKVSGGTATLNSNDIWSGNTLLTGGNLTLDHISHDATIGGNYNQTSGGLLLTNGSTLKLGTGSAIIGGNLVYGAGSNTLDVSTGGVYASASPINITAGNNLNVSGGQASINGLGAGTSAGTINLSSGSLVLNSVTSNGIFNQSGGTSIIDSGSRLTLNDSSVLSGGLMYNNGRIDITNTADKTIATSLSGNGRIDKAGAGTLLLTGQNLTYTGSLHILGGLVDFNVDSGRNDSYISGQTYLEGGGLKMAYGRIGLYDANVNLANGSTLTIDTNGHSVTSLGNTYITSTAGQGNSLDKNGAGSYTVLAGSQGNFNYNLNVNQGSMNVIANTANFNDNVNVGSGAMLRVDSRDPNGANFNNNLTLSHGYLSILGNGFNVTNNLNVGSIVNTMNGVVATNNIGGNLNIGASGIGEYLIDISPKAGTSDKYAIGGDITTTNNNGVIKVSDFRIVGAPTLVQSVNLKIFDAAGTIDPLHKGIEFKATDRLITSPLGQYGLSSLGSGNYSLGWKDFNPQVFRGQVATEASYANQLTTNNIVFDHIGLVSQQLLSEEKPNMYANENPLFAPYQYSKKDGGLWYKAFSNIERLGLTQGINTQNNMWGTLVGADLPMIDLKRGWKAVPTAYFGYTGAYQSYKGVSMYQNGGQAGAMGTFYKDDFITSLLANAGGYGNDMSLEGTTDRTNNWFAGVASKSAYNIKLPKDFILQPTALVGYSAFGKQNWSSDFGKVNMNTGMMNGLNVAPGLNLILNKETWSVYATTQLMFNVMNGTDGSTGDVKLPTVKMASTYFQYGVGFTKRIKDRLTMYTQILMSNGVRTGVGFQGGLQWKI